MVEEKNEIHGWNLGFKKSRREREFIVEKGKKKKKEKKNNISKRTVYSGTSFIYIPKKRYKSRSFIQIHQLSKINL